jgi:hypothetical protein
MLATILAGWQDVDPATVGWLTVAALVWSAFKGWQALIWPYAACGHCSGSGRHRSPCGANWRLCRRCKGSGRKVRLGARMLRGLRDGNR